MQGSNPITTTQIEHNNCYYFCEFSQNPSRHIHTHKQSNQTVYIYDSPNQSIEYVSLNIMRIMLNLFINYSCYYVNQPHDSVLKFSVFMNTIAFREKKRDREKIGVASQIDWKRKKKAK